MPSKMIYMNDENIEKLKTVDNMSGLINELLTAHFKKHCDKSAILSEINDLEARKALAEANLQVVTVKEKEIASIEQVNVDKEKARQDAWLNSEARWDNLRNLQKDAWDAYDGTEDQFTLFFQDLKDGRCKNMAEWTDNHGVHKKTVKKLIGLGIEEGE